MTYFCVRIINAKVVLGAAMCMIASVPHGLLNLAFYGNHFQGTSTAVRDERQRRVGAEAWMGDCFTCGNSDRAILSVRVYLYDSTSGRAGGSETGSEDAALGELALPTARPLA